MQGMKPSWTPPPPPKCPRILAQTLPLRPGRPRANQKGHKIQRKRVCPPMRLIHPGVVTCLLAEAPRRSSPSRIPSGGGGQRVPRVLCPIAPLGRVEFPHRDTFESTLPVPRVGRAGEDGGMPRSISPYRARVVPPVSLPPACTGRIAAAAWASPGLAPTPEPPRIIAAPISDLNVPMDLVEEAMAVLSFPEGLSSWFAAAFDIPIVCPSSGELLANKPLRVDIPLPFSAPHPETWHNGGGEWTNNGSVLVKFGDSPILEFTAGMQEAMYDVPQSALRPGLPPGAAPCVPVVPMLAEFASAGMAAAGSESPYLVAGTDEAASSAFEEVATGFSFDGVTARTPQPVKRERVMPRLSYATRAAAHRHTAGVSTQMLPTKAGHDFSGKGNLQLQEAGRPTWRDWSSNGDEAARSLNSFGPVWRDSDELLEAEHVAPSSSHPWLGAQKSPDRSLPSIGARGLSTKLAESRSVFALDPTLRRKRTQYPTCVSGKPPTKHKAPPWDGKARTKAVSSRRKRRTGAVVWKDALEVPRGVLVDTEGTLTTGADAEGASGTNVHGFSGYQPRVQNLVRAAHDGPVPVWFPPDTKKPESPPLRRMIQPLRARKVGRGARSKKTLTFDDALPIVVQHRPGGAHLAQTQARVFTKGSFLSLASSSAAVWKSIASIPEDPPPAPRPRASGHPHRKGRDNVEQRRTLFSKARVDGVVSPRIPPGPWSTPPFS